MRILLVLQAEGPVVYDGDEAYSNFFAKRAAYPAFKRKSGNQSVNYAHNGFTFNAGNRQLKLAKIGALKIKWSRDSIPEPSSVRLVRRASGKYFVSFVVGIAPVQLPATGQSVGIDFGFNRLATFSTGERIANPKHGARWARRVARLSRELARKTKGSHRRAICRCKLARVHEKIGACRKDTVNKLAWNLVNRFDVIYVEDLNLRGMVKNHNLARAVSDASMGAAIRTIETKAKMHGKAVVKIDRWFPSSKTCSACGYINAAVVLGVDAWTCSQCGVRHDRDDNAAKNILAVGQTVNAHGAGVRTVAPKGTKANRRRSANQPLSACV